MSSKKIIVVCGATGVQGGSVVRYLLEEGTFAVRGITRNPDGPAAKALIAQGAEVVKADMRDLASIKEAFKGAYGIFGNTNFWEPGVGYEGEVTQGKLLIDAAKASGVKHFVYSTLDSTEFKPAHWESKALVDQYLKDSGVPRTSLYTSFYYENFTTMLRIKKKADGSYDFPIPITVDAPFAVYSAEETGAYVRAAFNHPEKWINKDLRVASEFITAKQVCKVFSDILGKTVHPPPISKMTVEGFEKIGFPAEFHHNMEALFATAGLPHRDIELTRQLNPPVLSFKKWAEANKGALFD